MKTIQLPTKKILLIGIPFIILCFSIGLSAAVSRFNLKSLYVVSKYEKLRGLHYLDGVNLLFFNTDHYKDMFLNINTTVKTVRIDKLWPSGLRLTPEFRIPVAFIDSGKMQIPIDEEGYIVDVFDENVTKLYMIKIEHTPFPSGKKADWVIVKALEYKKLFDLNGMIINDISVKDNESAYHINLNNKTVIIIPESENPEIIVTSLQTILTRFRIEGKNVTKINFLFDKPVVTFSNGEKITSI